MATEKNITMKQFNGTEYDTLYPKTIASQVDGVYNKTEILTAATAALLGGDENMLPDEAFAALAAITSENASAIEALTPYRTKIEIGSYAGAGTNSKTITFSFSPKLVILSVNSFGPCNSDNGWDSTKGVILTNSQRTVNLSTNYASAVIFSGNNVQITSNDSNAARAFNYSGFTYYYIAIG